MAVNSIVGLLK